MGIHASSASNVCGPCGALTSIGSNFVVTSLIPLNDGHPLRYNFHRELDGYYDEDECLTWALKGSAAYRYSRSFGREHIASLLYQYDPLTFQGATFNTQVGLPTATRLPNALYAENFALGDATNASLYVVPTLQYNTIDLAFDLQLDNCIDGLYLHVGVPVQNANYQLKACSQQGYLGTTFEKGEMASEFTSGVSPISQVISTSPLQSSLTPASSLTQALGGYAIGDMQGRQYSKFNFACNPGSVGCNNIWGVADVVVQLGWDGWKRETSHIGLYLRSSIPTGTHINQEWQAYTFSPVIGNGHHWELGLGLSAHADVWSCDDRVFSLNFDGYATHLFGTNQFRTFDLNGLPMSRYMLVKAFSNVNNSLVYQNQLYAVADVISQCINVSVPLKGEFIAEMAYKTDCWRGSFGYAFSGQQAEQTSSPVSLTNANNYLFGFMGSAGVQNPATTNTSLAGTAWTTNLVSPDATAYTGGTLTTPLNPAITLNGEAVPDFGVPATLSNMLTASDINVNSGLMNQQIINRIYGSYEYTFNECKFKPFVGVMGSVGWSPLDSYTPQMWDVSVRLGFEY